MKQRVGNETMQILNAGVAIQEMENNWVWNHLTKTEAKADTIRRVQAKPGTLNLPPLLEKRRIEYAIPDGLFLEQPTFDRVFIYQIRLRSCKDTLGDESRIALSAISMQRELESAPYGILISAGLGALDSLRSNGVDLGHIVGFIREAPWRKPVDYIEGIEFYTMLLRVGDITGSLDLADALKKGECKIHIREIKSDDGIVTREHVYVDKEGKTWNPAPTFVPADL